MVLYAWNHEGLLMGAVAKQEACGISVLATKLFILKMGLKFVLDCSFFSLTNCGIRLFEYCTSSK